MDKETLRRIAAVTLIIALVVIGSPIKVTMHAQAGIWSVEDPLNAAIAPHFTKVVYSLVAPAYSTPCDSRGHLKALTGTPTISVNDSRVVLSAISSGPNSMVLSKTDVPAINKTTAHYQMAFNVSNTLSWANISLYDNHKDWINISIHSGAVYSDYDSGTRQLAVFYSPAVAGTDYMVAFDLTPSSVTLYLYSSAGILLADKYISNARLVGGDLDEIRWELSGSSSAKLYLDYLYVANSTGAAEISDPTALGPIHTDDDLDVGRCDLDPTTLTLDEGLREELFGFDSSPLSRQMTREDLVNSIGSIGIHEQRAAGRLVADGYKDVAASIDGALISYIASAENCYISDVHLIDYYIDYMQMKVSVDREVVDKITDSFDKNVEGVVDQAGGTLVSSVQNSVLRAQVLVNASDGWAALGYLVCPPFVISEACRGLKDWDPLGTKDAQEDLQNLIDKANARGDAAWENATIIWNNAMDVMNDWRQSSDEAFKQVGENYLNFVSMSNAQLSKLSSDYTGTIDKFERSVSKFYSYAENQFESTNAIIARLLLNNEVLSNGTQRLNEYFAGEFAKTNEVVLNLTSALTKSLNPQDFWASVLNDGKAQSTPLSFSGIFGNNTQTWISIIVIGVVSLIVVAAIVMFMRPRRARNRKS